VPCERRVRKLYFPPREMYFGCRACHNLTYESAQTHDHRIYLLMRDPVAVIKAVNSDNPDEKIRGLQAYAKLMGLL